ncbi:MAG: multi-copper polyphenol oxidoreductase [Gammaproteobacteria bacterium]|nr:MAG: multi-copper polyphenol oxidoreductase [Gammaproteobacteria bacterium]
MDRQSYLSITWPETWQRCPEHVHAITTLKNGGFSTGEFSTFNLAGHVGDDVSSVKNNRAKLRTDCQLPSEPIWLEQVHGNKVINADAQRVKNTGLIQADASFTQTKGVVCAVLTADCLPVFFCNKAATEVAVAHAGWRGLHAGIISQTVQAMSSPAAEILVSLGPAIGPRAFEVGGDVFRAFVDANRQNVSAFVATTRGHYLCDIYQLARNELRSLGIDNIAGGDYCTFRDEQLFYSFRRQKNTGRMSNLIWIE